MPVEGNFAAAGREASKIILMMQSRGLQPAAREAPQSGRRN
jgi:hypothetical protein